MKGNELCMNAKEYLRQIEVLDKKIEQRIEESEALHALITGGAISYDSDKVQSSIHGNTQEDRLCSYMDLRNEIDSLIEELADLRHTIIGQIHELEAGKYTSLYVDILYKKYVDCNSLHDISEELHYDYRWICKLHGRALQCFGNQILEATKSDY